MNRPGLGKLLILLVVSLTLTACGGGSGVGPDVGPIDASDCLSSITLKLLDTAGDPVTQINGSEQARAEAKVRGCDDRGVSGVLVTYSTTIGTLSGNGSAVTDNTGTATIVVTAGSTEGSGAITASASYTDNGVAVSDNSTPVAFSSDGQGGGGPGASTQYSATLALSPLTISRDTPGTATVTVTNSDAAPIQGAIVTFSTTRGGIADVALFTDASGVATTTVTAGTTAGSANLSASVTVGEQTISATPVITYITDGDAFATIDLVLTIPSTTGDVTNADPATATATVIGADGQPAAETLVSFSLAGGVGELNNDAERTNVSGVATVTLLAGTVAGAGAITAKATVGNAQVSDTVEFDSAGDGPFAGQGSSNLTIVLELVDDTGTVIDPPNIDADTPGVLQATVTDALGVGVGEIIVRFAADLGDLFPQNGLVLTNANGVATASLTAGSTPGAGNASAAIVIDNQTFDSDSMTFSTLGNAGDTAINLTVTFADATPNNNSNIITSSEPGTLTVLVEDSGGTNLPNRTVTLKTTLGALSTGAFCPALEVQGFTTLSKTTDAQGMVEVLVCGFTSIGTGSIGVTVGDTTETVQFDIGVDGLQLGSLVGGTFTPEDMTISVNPLSAGGTSKVTVHVVDQLEDPISDIDITFTSGCSQSGEAQISSTATSDASGAAIATYLAKGCVGNDTITATETGSGATATGIINVLPAQIGSITFVSVDDASIQIKESGGTESTNVTFQVLDVENQPAPDQDVSFELTTHVGGLSLVSTTGLTDANGFVSATVAAGYIPTTVRVRASVGVDTDNDGVDDTTLVTLSEKLSVNTGIADQNSMSINVSAFNIEGDAFDGVTTSIGIRLSDAFNNPVADDTTIEFQTELGTVLPSCGTLNGTCQVQWISSEPRTPLNPNVEFKTVGEDNCPVARINEEQVTIDAAGKGETNYKVNVDSGMIVKYEGLFTYVYLTEDTDYRIDTDGGGFTCLAGGSAECDVGKVVLVTYIREWLDEDPYDIEEETTTVSGGAATLAETMDIDIEPEIYDSSDITLRLGSDYTVNGDGSGITCAASSTECVEGATLYVSYDKIFTGADKSHLISHPGVATKPWSEKDFVPCVASDRETSQDASAYFGGLGQPYGGRSAVLAYALGEESFIDSNGNGLYDFNEPFVDLPEAFLDKNEDGVFGNGDPTVDDSRDLTHPDCYGPTAPITNPAEQLDKCFQEYGDEETFIDLGDELTLNNRYDAGNGIYNGTLCPKEVSDRTSLCDNVGTPCTSTDRYCTRDLINIRRLIPILPRGSDAYFGIRSLNGEYISAVDLSGTLSSSQFSATQTVFANDGSPVGAGTPFTIGDTESSTVVAPRVGESVALTSGLGSVVVDVSDIYNGPLPATATISVSSGTDGCVIQNSPGGVVGSTSGFWFTAIGISLGAPTSPASGSAPITITVITENDVQSSASFQCSY